MNGGGGGEGAGPDQHGMITLEDLESFTEDQLSDSGNGSLEEEGETMEEEGQDRLLHYWQDVARGHQVDVPEGIFFLNSYVQAKTTMYINKKWKRRSTRTCLTLGRIAPLPAGIPLH